MEQKYKTYIKASTFKRISAFLMDCLLIFIGTCLLAIAVNFVVINTKGYKEVNKQYNEIAFRSPIFFNNDGKPSLVEEDIDNALFLFYKEYDEINHLENSYRNIKSESSLFKYDELLDSYIEIGTEEEMKKFYKIELNKAYYLFLSSDDVSGLVTKTNIYTLITISISLFASTLIFWLIIPLFLKDGASLGKKMVGLSYVSTKSFGNKVGKTAIILNFTIFFIICVVFSFLLLGIPLAINGIFILVNKNGYGIGDYYTGMVMIDKNKFYSKSQSVKEISIPAIPSLDGKEDEYEF